MERFIKSDRELNIMSDIVFKNYNGRKIVLWGNSNELREVLKERYHLKVEFVVTSLEHIVNGTSIRRLEELRGKKEQYYLVAFGRAYEPKYHEILLGYGYREIEDFVYRMIKPISINELDLSKGNYKDIYGNIVEGKAGKIKKIIFRGYNNRIAIGDHVGDLSNTEFEMNANGEIAIKDGVRFNRQISFKMFGYNGSSKIFIDKNCRFSGSNFVLYNHSRSSEIIINENSTFENNVDFHSNSGKKIIIGRDCMFSHDILLQAGDGHAIFDVRTQQNINSIYKESDLRKNLLVIGEHVWVSAKALILHGTNIGNGSIIGAGSVVKGAFPNNCAVAGNPAQKIKDDVSWSRDNCVEDINQCGRKDYIALTNHANPSISGRKVLVVGGTRFMGVQLVKELLAKGNQVTIATRGNKADPFGNRINRLIMDLADADSVSAALKGKSFDIVFDNLAYCSNYVRNLLSSVQCKRYIQLSSVEVYTPTKIDLKEEEFNPYKINQEWCDMSAGYQKGKRQAEATIYQIFSEIPAVTVRIPYVTKTDRLFYYCRNIVNQTPMKIDDIKRGFTFVQDTEVGRFLPWIAAQDYTGPINLASAGIVTIEEILKYIEKKTGKKAILDMEQGEESPFHEFNEQTFTMNMDKASNLGYSVSALRDWFWKLMDEYIARAVKEKNNPGNTNFEPQINPEHTIRCVEQSKCTGCGACMNSCPKDAISLCLNEEGFFMPRVDDAKCVSCGLCKKVCPVISNISYEKNSISCYAMMAQDDLRMISSSGGAFSLFAEHILDQGGVVCGAVWAKNYSVEHVIVDNKEDLVSMRGSKYVQSNTRETYRETKKYLESGKKVLYTGMPCQIDGLLHYLQEDYEGLYTIDLLCRGIASNELFKRFVKENYKDKKIKNISFKDKRPLGWGATTSYQFEDGTVEKTNTHNSFWMCSYLENIMDRQSCYICKFNNIKRVGDVSIGDFWGIEKYEKKYNDAKGTSIVITNSDKGEQLVNGIKEKCKLLKKVPLKHAVPYNSALCAHVKMTPKRQRFFEAIKKMPIPAAVDRVIYGEKYKVGIIGWWYNLNYGGTMTYYALNQSIQKLGYSVLMVRKSSPGPHMPNDNTIPMRFAKKHYNISRLYTTRDLHWVNYSCHAFISGSDQLWNPYLEEYSGPEFFLSFVNAHNLKISYASSFGNIKEVSPEFREKYQPYLKRFDAVSVREDYAVEICQRDFGIHAVQLCDPIFLCNAEEYRKIADDSKAKFGQKYLLNFILDPNQEKVKAYRYVKERLQMKSIVNFTDLQQVEERVRKFEGDPVYGNAEIEDFVKAYAGAEFVVTDSFHGTCLAIIFNKPFIAIANKERGEKRFVSLLKWLQLSDRLVFDVNDIYKRNDLLTNVDFTNANRIIQNTQKESFEWLKNVLSKMV